MNKQLTKVDEESVDDNSFGDEYYYDDEFPRPLEENPEPEHELTDVVYQSLMERNTALLEEISQLKEDHGLQVEHLTRHSRELEVRLQSVVNKYDEKVPELEAELVKSKEGLLRQARSVQNVEKTGLMQIAELTAENTRLIEQRRRCADLAKRSVIDFKVLKAQVLESIEYENCSSDLTALQENLDRVSAEKEKLMQRVRKLQTDLGQTIRDLDDARQAVTIREGECGALDHVVKELRRERDDLLEYVRDLRGKPSQSRAISVDYDEPRYLHDEINLEGNAGRSLEWQMANAE